MMDSDALSSLDPDSYEQVYVCQICNGISTETLCRNDHSSCTSNYAFVSNNSKDIDFENYITPSFLSSSELGPFREEKRRKHIDLESRICLTISPTIQKGGQFRSRRKVKPSYMCSICGDVSTNEICRNDHNFDVPKDLCNRCGIKFESVQELMEHCKDHKTDKPIQEQDVAPSDTFSLITSPSLNKILNDTWTFKKPSAVASLPQNFANLVHKGTLGMGQYQVVTSSTDFIKQDTSSKDDEILNWDDDMEVALLDKQNNGEEICVNDENLSATTHTNDSSGIDLTKVLATNEKWCATQANTVGTNSFVNQQVIKYLPKENRKYPRCVTCDLEVPDIDSLIAHSMSHGSPPAYKCQFCPRIYSRSYWFISHLKLHVHQLPIVCTFCDESFLASKEHEEHLRIVHQMNSSELNQLIQSLKNDEADHIMCMQCGRWMKSEKHFDLHVKIHEMANGRTVTLNHTSGPIEQSPTSSSRQNSVQPTNGSAVVINGIPSRKPIHIFECNICLATIKSIEEVRLHLATHARSRLYKCEVCSARFSTSTQLQQHSCANLAKTASNQHKCVECEKIFNHAAGLACHLRTHSTNAANVFHCDKCPLSFKMLSTYLIHRARSH